MQNMFSAYFGLRKSIDLQLLHVYFQQNVRSQPQRPLALVDDTRITSPGGGRFQMGGTGRPQISE